MPRQKKLTKYIPNTKTFSDHRSMQHFLWDKRTEFTLEQLIEWNREWYNGANYGKMNDKTDDYIKTFRDRLANNNVDATNWNTGSYYSWPISQMLEKGFIATNWFNEMNEAFLAEYDSREDLQELYKKFYDGTNWITDRYENSFSVNHYYRNTELITNEEVRALREKYSERPESFIMWNSVVDRAEVRKFIEIQRETPYQPGDLVKLRAAFIGRDGYDPLFVSNYDVYARGMSPTPDKSVDRIGTLMAITNDMKGWRGSKGSKVIEVMWIGQENTSFIPERAVKWEERPTFKNGLKQR